MASLGPPERARLARALDREEVWETRHVFGDDPWPYLVFADRPDLPAGAQWRATPSRFAFLNAAAE